MNRILIWMMLFLCASHLSFAKNEPKKSILPTVTPSPTPIPKPTPLLDIDLMQNTLESPNSKLHKSEDTTEIAPISLATDSLSKEIELRKLMLDWSRHLGVTCNYCHDTNNFKNDEKLAFKVGLKHKGLVRLLNEEVFTERDKGGTLKVVADCYMCHRGYSTPQFKEPPQNLMK